MSQLSVVFGNQTKTYNVNLSGDNIKKKLAYQTKIGNKPSQIFDFTKSKFTVQDKTMFQKLCAALDKLKALGGDKNVIDDSDFSARNVANKPCSKNSWHCDDEMDLDYHNNDNSGFFIEN